MSMTLLFSFLGAAILLTLMPGPDNLFVLAQSISQNKKAGIMTTLGLCTGILVHTTAAALGISAIVYQSTLAFTIVKYAGAIYLLYLAWGALREKDASFDIEEQAHIGYGKLYRRGVLMNVLNPKVSLFFLALFPQFLDTSPDAWSIPFQMIVLGFIFMVQAFLIFSGVSIFAEIVRGWLMRFPSLGKRINVIKGFLLGLIGLKLALGGGGK
ncbi:LysE family translocator [Pontibacillus marinus]|uniref:Threonine transporter RhtB n=1 Tax=Pontibacillus marinus BH030004 = DSM 16465 TaxID=1385511 RepID=A0A0A5FTE3_9BACI|nr:LysE family translocator [Pontibacillus marinus]KGX84006.1 threonine transporter RhtB [Pontibacillus marinus BH030004 = DSM 16465]